MREVTIAAASGQTAGANGVEIATLVGFFFGARVALVLLFVQVLGVEPRTGAAAALGVQAALLGLVAFCTLGEGDISLRAFLRPSPIRWVLAYLLVAGASLFWSETASLPNSVAYWCGLMEDVLIMWLLMRTVRSHGKSTSIMRGFIAAACLIALVAWLMPAQADLRLGNEDFLNTNQIANLCALAILMAQYLRRIRGQGYQIVLLFLSLTLLRSLSKSTLIAFLICQIWTVARDRSIQRIVKVRLASAVVLLLLLFSGLFAAYYDVYTRAGNQAETLTGRTAIWAYVATEITARPWLGHGFDSMWKVIPPFGLDRFEARHAENELLQQVYSYGVGGIVLILGVYGSLWRVSLRLPRGPLRQMLIGLLLFTVIRGLAVAEPFDLLLPLWMCVLLADMGLESGTAKSLQSMLSYSCAESSVSAP